MKAKTWLQRRNGGASPTPNKPAPERARARLPERAREKPVTVQPRGPGYVADPYVPGPTCEVVKPDPKGDPWERCLAGIPELKTGEISVEDRAEVERASRYLPRRGSGF